MQRDELEIGVTTASQLPVRNLCDYKTFGAIIPGSLKSISVAMPTFPQTSQSAREIEFSSFGSMASRIAQLQGEGSLIPLHLGDTYLPPPQSALNISLRPDYLHRYGPLEGF